MQISVLVTCKLLQIPIMLFYYSYSDTCLMNGIYVTPHFIACNNKVRKYHFLTNRIFQNDNVGSKKNRTVYLDGIWMVLERKANDPAP